MASTPDQRLPSIIEYLNPTKTTARVYGFAGDSGYLVVTQGGSPAMDSAIIVVCPVRVATIRLSPDTLRIALDEQGILYPLLEDSSGPAHRARTAWRRCERERRRTGDGQACRQHGRVRDRRGADGFGRRRGARSVTISADA